MPLKHHISSNPIITLVQDPEEFYNMLTIEQIDFLSSYKLVYTEGINIPNGYYGSGVIWFVGPGLYVYGSEVSLRVNDDPPQIYVHPLNPIKTYIREKKINHILE